MKAFAAGVVVGMLKEAGKRKKRKGTLAEYQATARAVAHRVAQAVVDDLFSRVREGQIARWR
jgi:hypothetical protein